MTTDPATPVPRRHGWRIGLMLFAALLAVTGYGLWREYAFRAASKKAEAIGWTWSYDDPFDTIRQDWKSAFQKETWRDGRRDLIINYSKEMDEHPNLLSRLNPRALRCSNLFEYKDLSCFTCLSSLRELHLVYCNELTDATALKDFKELKVLALHGSRLKSFDPLKGLTNLQELYVGGGDSVTNLDALKGLTALGWLHLFGCNKLTNLDGLAALSNLQEIRLTACPGLSQRTVNALRKVMPNTHIDWTRNNESDSP